LAVILLAPNMLHEASKLKYLRDHSFPSSLSTVLNPLNEPLIVNKSALYLFDHYFKIIPKIQTLKLI